MQEHTWAHGRFTAWLFEREGGPLIREIPFDNTVVNVGKAMTWNTLFLGSAYTTATIYMGLISSVSFTGTTASDTMASHSGWLECNATNAPAYGASRPSVTFSSSSGASISLTSAASYTFTNTGTVQGAFIVLGGAAGNTTTTGTLFSAGAFGAAQPVISGNVLQVSYSVSM